jgi:hypothetical protein
MEDQTKIVLFLAFAVLVLVLVSNGKRPLASAPLDGNDRPGESQTELEGDVQPTWAVNNPNTGYPPPLSLMVPDAGGAPITAQ